MINISIKEGPLSEALKIYGSKKAAAKALELPESTFRDRLKKEQGIPSGQKLRGVSTLYDSDGMVKQQWVKTQIDQERQEEALLATVDALKVDIPKEKAKKFKGETNDNLLSCYVVTDYHLGQLSWKEETGADWDLEIAQNLLIRWFATAIESAPDSKVAVLAQLGDFLHYDGLVAITPTSGHILDADTRYPKLVMAAIKVVRCIVQMLLEKHEHVHIIMAEGNHDLASSVWLRALFAEKYSDEPRVTVDNTHTPYYCYPWGNTCLFFHHGHKKNVKNVSMTLAGMFREQFGKSRYPYAHTGHLHHAEMKEDQLMIVEQHQTLAVPDAHSARGGYVSQRSAKVITYSKTAGEVSRLTIRPEIIQ